MRIFTGKYGRRRFDVPTNITARPTTDFARENLFNVLTGLTDFDDCSALDLFAGTGAVSFELLSRGCAPVTAVEKASTQVNFIRKVAGILHDDNIRVVHGDALRYIDTCATAYDIVFADPPYSMDGFADIPGRVLASKLLHPGSIFVIEHSKAHDFSALPHFIDHRQYGSVNFSIFRIDG